MLSWKDCLANGLQGSACLFSDTPTESWKRILIASAEPLAERKELRSLKDEEKHLFIEGMAWFQNEPMLDPLSYFQIAGKSCR